jgi:hypothetical protein
MKAKQTIYKIGLVACCGEKLSHKAPASELYQSALFKKSRLYVEQTCDAWGILSAMHGFIIPTRCIEPYDVTLARMTVKERSAWSAEVRRQLIGRYCHFVPEKLLFVILAGADYRAPFKDDFPFAVEFPLQGLGIGKQLQWLTRQNNLQGCC